MFARWMHSIGGEPVGLLSTRRVVPVSHRGNLGASEFPATRTAVTGCQLSLSDPVERHGLVPSCGDLLYDSHSHLVLTVPTSASVRGALPTFHNYLGSRRISFVVDPNRPDTAKAIVAVTIIQSPTAVAHLQHQASPQARWTGHLCPAPGPLSRAQPPICDES
jgi:hypothetical protein